jgi:hypothetical protein
MSIAAVRRSWSRQRRVLGRRQGINLSLEVRFCKLTEPVPQEAPAKRQQSWTWHHHLRADLDSYLFAAGYQGWSNYAHRG